MHIKIVSAKVSSCVYLLTFLTNISLDANSVDPDEQSNLDQHCLTKRLLKHFRRQQRQPNFVVIGALWVKSAA